MAIAFARVCIHSRSKGHSAVAASAYRTRSTLFDHRTGITYDFSNRGGLAFSEIRLPQGASPAFLNREWLWNEVERAERRKDSQVCKDVILALPQELGLTQHIDLTRRFAIAHFVEKGLVCEIAIHDDSDGNPHAHLLVTLRRLEGNRFAKHKARDLNPSFFKGTLIEGDGWNKQWRDFQNDYFQEKNIDLTVDLDHLIPQRHESPGHNKTPSYLQEENQLIYAAREALALDDLDNLMNQLSLTHSVFTRREVEKLLFKMLRSEDARQSYLSLVEQLLAHQDIILLGPNDRGLDCYTTRQQYLAEGQLLDDVHALETRKTHVFNEPSMGFIEPYQLSEEQAKAFSFITQGPDLSLLIGRPGVGKSYLLKPIKDYYETHQCRVLGASLSGKVAKALQADTGIPSSTIASLTYRLTKQQLTLTKNDILVIDEAGMVDFASMACLLSHANQAKAKVILVGDPDQLKPINKGEIFRGIAARSGYIDLTDIRRQRQEGDRQASLNLAQGNIEAAFMHYVSQDAVKLEDTPKAAKELLLERWLSRLQEKNSKEHLMLAFTRKTVASLNHEARLKLKENKLLPETDYCYSTQEGKSIKLTQGERILLTQNNKALGVRNGDLASITAINADYLHATLDTGEQVRIPKDYKQLDYGYALTVHKTQGMTVNEASVLIDSKYWDKHLSFVAMTRHRNQLTIYADKENHPDLAALTKTLSRTSTKDNVIDWPLDFAIRQGFNPDKILGRAIKAIAGMNQTIKHKWNYLVRYEAYLKAQLLETTLSDKQVRRQAAKEIALYFDNKRTLKKEIDLVKQEAIDKTKSPHLDSLYQKNLAQDKQAYELVKNHGQSFEKMSIMQQDIQSLYVDKNRYERYLTIKAIVQLPAHEKADSALLSKAANIDLKKDYPHLIRLAHEHDKKAKDLYQQIKNLKRLHQEQVFKTLKKEHPLLAQYHQLVVKRAKCSGFNGEQIDKLLQTKAKEMIKNKPLHEALKQHLSPYLEAIMLKASLQEHARHHER